MYKLPDPSTATSYGFPKVALVAAPPSPPLPEEYGLPATVSTLPGAHDELPGFAKDPTAHTVHVVAETAPRTAL